MNLQDLETLYDCETIEGVAFASLDGELVVNQLAAPLPISQRLAQSAAEFLRTASLTNRTPQGTVVSQGSFSLLVVSVSSGILIAQTDPNAAYQEAWTAIERSTASRPRLPEGSPNGRLPDPAASPWIAYRKALLEILAAVAPLALAQSIVTGAEAEAGLAPGEIPSVEKIKTIGQLSVAAILNPGGQKIVSFRLQNLHAKLGL